VSKDFFLGLFRLGIVFGSLNFNNVLLALALFEKIIILKCGCNPNKESDGKKRSKHGTHGICTKKEEKKQGVCHIVAMPFTLNEGR
jgi:hypothetical protein